MSSITIKLLCTVIQYKIESRTHLLCDNLSSIISANYTPPRNVRNKGFSHLSGNLQQVPVGDIFYGVAGAGTPICR